jgi:hypothetical protein
VEVSPNFVGRSETITALYRDFFKQYLDKFGQEQRLQTKKVIIGEGYSDALDELPEIQNTYAPQAPVSYSDKTHGQVRLLDMEESDSVLILKRNINIDEIPQLEQNDISITGVEPLTFESALQVAYIEGKAYADNKSLIQYLHNMENGLIAKDINNATKDKPNMSISYRDKAGKMQGYMFAYEGILDENSREFKDYTGKPFVYISDLAVVDKSSLGGAKAGASLIQGFSELYKKNYLDKGNLTPIFAQAREETSYRLIQRKLGEISRGTGYVFIVEELEPYTMGNSTMHPVIIRPTT